MFKIVALARLTQPNFIKVATTSGTAQLLTIPYSHYCEFSRWCLTAGGSVTYEEHGYAPGAHVLPTLALRVGGPTKHLSPSSYVQPAPRQDPTTSPSPSSSPSKNPRARPTSVPIIVLPDGQVLTDSWQIAEAGLSPSGRGQIDAGLKKVLDTEIAPLARQLAYVGLLQPRHAAHWRNLCCSAGGIAYGTAWRFGLGSWLTNNMIATFATDDASAAEAAEAQLMASFEAVERDYLTPLTSSGQPFLGGATPGLADFAVAALAAPVVMPPRFCEGAYADIFDAVARDDEVYTAQIAQFRDTAVGQYAMRVYKDHR